MADSDIQEGLEDVAQAAGDVAVAAAAAAQASSNPAPKKQFGRTLEFILDVALQVTVEVGRTRMTIQDLLQLGQGSVVELEKLAGEPLDIYINGKAVARGEAVIVNDKFGVRLTDIVSPEDRIEGLEG
jgi:flagellar motor switch protein FliN/FliY